MITFPFHIFSKCIDACPGGVNFVPVAPVVVAPATAVAPNSCVHEDCKDWNCDKWCECFDGTSCAASVLFFNRSLPAIAHSRFNLRSFFFALSSSSSSSSSYLQRPRLRSTPALAATRSTTCRASAERRRRDSMATPSPKRQPHTDDRQMHGDGDW